MMTAGAASCGERDQNRSPFTPTQWQELEHQALIYKYMVSGVPIPPELIYSVKRSLDSSLASRLFPSQHIGWGFHVGFGRKADPEPGRCRRTDGKKWRCSKEAYPDSKYCERHMHRGRNRSRKHVEVITSSSAASTISSSSTEANPSPSISSLNRNLSMNFPNPSSSGSSYSFTPLSSSISPDMYAHQDPTQRNSHLNTFLYPHSSCSRPPGSSVLSPHENITNHHLFLDSGSSSHVDKDYRYFHGIREGVDERAFFPEASGGFRSFQNSCQPFTTMDVSYKGYSRHHQSQFVNFSDNSKQQADQEQSCFVLGNDFKSSSTRTTTKVEKEDETQRPLHHFFGEWPPKNTDSWLDISSNSRIHSDS